MIAYHNTTTAHFHPQLNFSLAKVLNIQFLDYQSVPVFFKKTRIFHRDQEKRKF